MVVPPIRVVIVDDSPLYRRTIRKILEKQPNFKIVAEAGDGVYGIQAVKTHKPHVVLMDVTLPILNGIEATRKIKSEFAKVRVIVLSVHNAESNSTAAHGAGACWCLNKDCSPTELINAIMAAKNDKL